MDPEWRVEVDGKDVGELFISEADAHSWVAQHHPAERYAIVHMPARAGAAKVEQFESADGQ